MRIETDLLSIYVNYIVCNKTRKYIKLANIKWDYVNMCSLMDTFMSVIPVYVGCT